MAAPLAQHAIETQDWKYDNKADDHTEGPTAKSLNSAGPLRRRGNETIEKPPA
jgi:hypothetical protein